MQRTLRPPSSLSTYSQHGHYAPIPAVPHSELFGCPASLSMGTTNVRVASACLFAHCHLQATHPQPRHSASSNLPEPFPCEARDHANAIARMQRPQHCDAGAGTAPASTQHPRQWQRRPSMPLPSARASRAHSPPSQAPPTWPQPSAVTSHPHQRSPNSFHSSQSRPRRSCYLLRDPAVAGAHQRTNRPMPPHPHSNTHGTPASSSIAH
jgi:hypothetical protein